MKFQKIFLLSCSVVLCVLLPNVSSQGTGKVQEFFKKYFGDYFPKTTRSYTLYGNGLNGPADFNAGLPVGEDHEGPIKNIIIRRQSQSARKPQQPQAQVPGADMLSVVPAPTLDNSWQPTNFDPVAFARGGHRGRSDLTAEFDEADESRIITAEDAEQLAGDGTREFKMESSMTFSPPSPSYSNSFQS